MTHKSLTQSLDEEASCRSVRSAAPHRPDAFSSSHALADDGELGCER
jgi:hypothetical protein